MKRLWCSACQKEHKVDEFGLDRTQPGRGGRATKCLASRRVKVRKKHPGRGMGWLTPARDGDRRQARRRVNYLVEQKRIPHPNELPCMDCGHTAGDGRRHEYDHARGYSSEHQLYVEAVCSTCHHMREIARRD